MLARTSLFTFVKSTGGVESLIEHPGIMAHVSIPEAERMKLGISDNIIRYQLALK